MAEIKLNETLCDKINLITKSIEVVQLKASAECNALIAKRTALIEELAQKHNLDIEKDIIYLDTYRAVMGGNNDKR